MTKRKLTDFRPQRANANAHTPQGMKALETSIQVDGWIGAITVAADGETFDGSARIETGAATGFEDAIVVESDGTRPVIVMRTDIPTADDPRARRLGIMANRVAELNLDWDAAQLEDALRNIETDNPTMAALLDDLAQAAGIVPGKEQTPEDLWRGMPEFEQEDLGAYKQLTVNFANEDDYQAFAALVGQRLTPQTRSIWHPQQQIESYIVNECADEP